MPDENVEAVRELLSRCTHDERRTILLELANGHHIHEYERIVGAPAELILESIHRANELTRRMLRGVIAECTYARFVIPTLTPKWRDIPLTENLPYDFLLADDVGEVKVQVKLQRSTKGAPTVRGGLRYGFTSVKVFECETQKTRTGEDDDEGESVKTRPYRYDEFDILAVSMQPSTQRWDEYLYTVGNWLVQGKKPNEISTKQPVESVLPNPFWTADFNEAVRWFRTLKNDRRMAVLPQKPKVKPIKIPRKRAKAPNTPGLFDPT